MSTITLNMHEAKTHLSGVVAKLKPNDRVVLCRRNKPVAEIRLIPASPSEPRPVGLGKGLASLPPSFFEPLPEDMQDGFEGRP